MRFPSRDFIASLVLLLISLCEMASAAETNSLQPARFAPQSDGLGFRWDVQSDGQVSGGTNNCFSGGFRLMVRNLEFRPKTRNMTADGEWILSGKFEDIGVGEIDRLIGGTASDHFVLGNPSGSFYDDNSEQSPGNNDYAHITDFTVGSDRLQLSGLPSQYHLGSKGISDLAGVGLFLERGETDELVAVIKSGDGSLLTKSNTINPALFV